MADFIPKSDADFDAWQINFINYASANAAALGLSSAQMTQLGTLSTNWDDDYAASQTAQSAATAAVQGKNGSRDAEEAYLRVLTAQIQANPAVTDAQRAALGITVPGSAPTPPATPTTRPIGSVDFGQMRTHIINFVDETTPTSKAKPAGVLGCEVWVKVGVPAPTSDADFTYLATDTRTPYAAQFEMDDIGKTAFYHLRWVTVSGERGPWSQTVSAVIGG